MDWLHRFDPEPQWYLWFLNSVSAVSLPIYLGGIIGILRVNLTSNSPTYKYLLAFNITMSYITQLSLSAGTAPILVLPTRGGYPLGFLSHLGLSTCVQCAVILCLFEANELTTIVLFFYRSHLASPFNRNLVYGLFLVSIAAIVVPAVAFSGFLCNAMDLDKMRDKFQKECPDMFAVLSNSQRSRLLIADEIPMVGVAANYLTVLQISAVTIISVFTYRATVLLRRKIFSPSAVAMHKALVRSLIIQTTVYYAFFLVPFVVILLLERFRLPLPNAANLSFLGISLSDPAGVLAMILAHKKYRRAVFRPFYKGSALLLQIVVLLAKSRPHRSFKETQ